MSSLKIIYHYISTVNSQLN